MSVPGAGRSVVLVHGGRAGAWSWRPVAQRLTARGFDVHRVTLSGVGDSATAGRRTASAA